MTRLAAAASIIMLGVACGALLGIGLGVVFSSVASAETLAADDSNAEVLRAAAPLDVPIGDTVTRDVGFALGLACDDFAPIRADLRTAASGTNVFEVTGVKLGDTVCRAGTTPTRPSFVFAVHVSPARH